MQRRFEIENGARIRLALLLVGFTSVIGQIVLMRELLIASVGNELSLGLTLTVWLLLTAVGSSLLGRFLRGANPIRVLVFLQAAIALALPAAIYLARSSRTWWNVAPGEALGPVQILLTAAITLAAFCPISGWLFAAGTRAWAASFRSSVAESCNSMYLFEALGSALGGVLASILLLRTMNSVQIAFGVAAVNLIAATLLGLRSRVLRIAASAIVVAACGLVFAFSGRLELRTASLSWPGFRTVALHNSPYGSLAVIENETSRSVVQNGIVQFTVPDPASAEESVHFAMAEHVAPRTVLLIGAGLNGSLAEILKYPTVTSVEYVEPDPALIALTRDQFRETWEHFAGEGRVQIHSMDGRLFLKFSPERYDVIITALPEPQTAQLNRFYTAEFFREAAAKLNSGGLLAFQVHGAEEYLSPQRAEFLRCLEATLQRAFKDTAVIPGETVHFLATNTHDALTVDPQVLVRRFHERGIRTSYVSEYFLPYRMAPERVADLRQQLAPTPATRINRDFSPVAYYFGVALWSKQFSSAPHDLFRAASQTTFPAVLSAILVISVLLALWYARPRAAGSLRASAGLAVALTGLTLMAVEVLLLLGFQAIYGYVFDELALIVSAFMAGLGLGAWLRMRLMRADRIRDSLGRLFLLQLGMFAAPLIASALLMGSSDFGPLALRIVAHVGIPLLAVACGVAGGMQFSLATHVWLAPEAGGSPGALYGLDLLGASAGAAIITIYLVPVFGFAETAALVATANIGPVLLLIVALRHTPALARSASAPD